MSATTPVSILGIPGSLRKASYNKAALRAAQELLPDGVTLAILDLPASTRTTNNTRLRRSWSSSGESEPRTRCCS